VPSPNKVHTGCEAGSQASAHTLSGRHQGLQEQVRTDVCARVHARAGVCILRGEGACAWEAAGPSGEGACFVGEAVSVCGWVWACMRVYAHVGVCGRDAGGWGVAWRCQEIFVVHAGVCMHRRACVLTVGVIHALLMAGTHTNAHTHTQTLRCLVELACSNWQLRSIAH